MKMNKKKLGLGMVLTGGAMAVVGMVVFRKGKKEEMESINELSQELKELDIDDMVSKIENLEENTELTTPLKDIQINEERKPVFDGKFIFKDENPEAAYTASYNPKAAHKALSSEDIENSNDALATF